MTLENKHIPDPLENADQSLRRRAIESLQAEDGISSVDLESLSPEEIRRTLHELRVHQIELEMQNEELRRTQVELETARERYFDLYDLAPVGYFTLSEKGLFLETNLTAAGLLGVSRNTLIRQPITRFIHKEDQDIYYHHHKQLFKTGTPQVCDLRMVKDDGTEFWAHLTASFARGAGGTPVCRVVMDDITQHMRQEEKIAASQKFLQDITDNSTMPIYALDPNGKFLLINRKLESMFGVPRETLIGKTRAEILPPEIAAAHRANDLQVIKTRQPITFEEVNREPDGTQTYLSVKFPLLDAKNNLYGIGGISTNITERMQIEAALRESEARLELFFAQSLDGFFFMMLDEPVRWDETVDKDQVLDYVFAHQRITKANNALISQYGTTREQYLGQTPNVFFAHDIEYGKQVWRQFFDQGQLHVTTNERKFDGTPIWIEGDYICLYDNEGRITGHFGIQRDVSTRVRAEEQVQRQIARQAALHSMDRLILASTELKMVLNILLEQITNQLEVDAADILLFNENLFTLDFAVGHGFRTNALQHTHLRLGEGSAGHAALTKKMVTIQNLEKVDQGFSQSQDFKEEQFVAYFGVPLIVKGQLRGVLEIFHRSRLHPDSEWLEFLNHLSDQVALGVNNIELFNGLQKANIEIIQAYDNTLEGWANALELRDKETEGHSDRVVQLTLELVKELGIAKEELVNVRRGALLHDIGKMGIPDSILLKPGPLTEPEWDMMKKHPVFAYELLSPITYLKNALDIPYCHHEKWDGTGYPRGLKGEQIPLSARVFAVVDVWDALRADRPYRKAWSKHKTLAYIKEQSGKHFDPRIVNLFLSRIK